MTTARRGLTLLETMVALVIVGLVALGYLELFGGTARTAARVRDWTRAVAYAEDAMETRKIAGRDASVADAEPLASGFQRRLERRAWRDNLDVVTVVVTMPDGGEFRLSRLMTAR